MDKENMNRIVHDLAFGKFINHLFVDYKDMKLSDGQLYTLYQKCCNTCDLEEMIGAGASEPLP